MHMLFCYMSLRYQWYAWMRWGPKKAIANKISKHTNNDKMIQITINSSSQKGGKTHQSLKKKINKMIKLLPVLLRNFQSDQQNSGFTATPNYREIITLYTGPNPPSPSLWVRWKSLVAETRVSNENCFCSRAAIVSMSSSPSLSGQSSDISKNQAQRS